MSAVALTCTCISQLKNLNKKYFKIAVPNFGSGKVSLGKGEIHCALAGLLYGVNIAVTGVYAKDFYAPMYVMIDTDLD